MLLAPKKKSQQRRVARDRKAAWRCNCASEFPNIYTYTQIEPLHFTDVQDKSLNFCLARVNFYILNLKSA